MAYTPPSPADFDFPASGVYTPPSPADFEMALGVTVVVGTAHETDSADQIRPDPVVVAVGTASEADSADAVTGLHSITVGTAAEVDSAGAVISGTVVEAVNTAAQTDSAGTIAPAKVVAVGTASEADTGGAVTGLYAIPVGTAFETDSASAVGIPVFALVGTASEADTAGEIDAPNLYHLSLPTILNSTGAALFLFNDWSAAVPAGTIYRWLLDIEGTTTVRIPIKSWQATLRADFSSYVQVVIPNVAPYLSDINARLGNDMAVIRQAVAPDGSTFEQEMARAPASTPRTQRGHTRHTMTLSGYVISFYTPDDYAPETARTLSAIQSITGGDETRVRCGIDWFLRPGQQAVADGDTINVSYISYIVNDTTQYMEVGGVAA